MKVLDVLRNFFPGMQYSKFNYFAGKFCPVAGGCAGAYPDLYIFTGDRVVFIEIDEGCHAQYDSSCELARYDALQYGSDHIKPSLCIRFNPGTRDSVLIRRCGVLVQMVRNYLNTPLHLDVAPVINVCFLFYNQAGKKHISAMRSQAANTLIMWDYKTPVTDIDIVQFCNSAKTWSKF